MWRNETDKAGIRVLVWSPLEEKEILPDRAMQELDALVEKRPAGDWILDVGAIPILSSNAIAQLIGVVRRVSLANGRIALANPAPAVSAVLKMTRLTKLLPMYDTVAAARASFV
jgi:anti-anti-sigma factor